MTDALDDSPGRFVRDTLLVLFAVYLVVIAAVYAVVMVL